MIDTILEGKRVFDIEIEALQKTRDTLDDTFDEILQLVINCKGKVVITGMGKPGHIAKKLAATFSSLGTPSFCLHPAEAQHGDLGMVSAEDIVIAISYSGESDEIVKILPNIKLIGAALVAITGNEHSTLAKAADVLQLLPKFEEACYLGLAPTSSTTAVLCYGDALAVVASAKYGFKDVDFGRYHPAGSLGKKLILKVKDAMATDAKNAVIDEKAPLKDAIIELSKKGLGIVTVVNSKNALLGVITDGDLRRQLEKNVNIYDLSVEDIMNANPITIASESMLVEAFQVLRERGLSCLPVLESGRVVGTIRLQTIINKGIV